MHLGERIRLKRQEQGYTLQQLADKVGISLSYLSEIERAVKKPSSRVLKNIAAALNTPLRVLLPDHLEKEKYTIGAKLVQTRQKLGLTTKELALKAGIIEAKLQEFEEERSYPPGAVLRKLAAVLKIPAEELFSCLDNNLGSKVYRLRSAQGWTQRELALRSGISTTMISKVEVGEIKPSMNTVEKLARALEVSCNYLLAEENDLEEIVANLPSKCRKLLLDSRVQIILEKVSSLDERELHFVLKMVDEFKRTSLDVR